MCVLPTRFHVVVAVVVLLPFVARAADKADRFERPSHYIVENDTIVNELGRTPLPLLDWGFVLAGHVEYRDRKTGRKLPLNDAHPLTDTADVEAVQVAVPF